MLGNLLNRMRRPRVGLDFETVTDTRSVARHSCGTFVIDEESPGRFVAFRYDEGLGYVALGEVRRETEARKLCEAVAAHLLSGRPLMALTTYWDEVGNRAQAVRASRTLDGGLTLQQFDDPAHRACLTPEETRDFIAGRKTVVRLGDRGRYVHDEGGVLAGCLATPGLLGVEEAFEGRWGVVRHAIRKAYGWSVTSREAAADHDAVEILRRHDEALAAGKEPDEVSVAAAARAASHLWDNFDVCRRLEGCELAGMIEALAERHEDRRYGHLYDPGR